MKIILNSEIKYSRWYVVPVFTCNKVVKVALAIIPRNYDPIIVF